MPDLVSLEKSKVNRSGMLCIVEDAADLYNKFDDILKAFQPEVLITVRQLPTYLSLDC